MHFSPKYLVKIDSQLISFTLIWDLDIYALKQNLDTKHLWRHMVTLIYYICTCKMKLSPVLFCKPVMLPPCGGAEAKSAKKSFSLDTFETAAGACKEPSDGPISRSTKSVLWACDTEATLVVAFGGCGLEFLTPILPKFAAAPRSIVFFGLDDNFGVAFLDDPALLTLSLSFSSEASSASSSSLWNVINN